MNKNNLKEISKVCPRNSILVLNNAGIYRLFCPFKAVCIQKIAEYAIGQEVIVIAVKMSNDYRLVYLIQNKGFYHHYFMIISKPTSVQTTFN